jgi:xylan 1,4-beta-xylosidase
LNTTFAIDIRVDARAPGQPLAHFWSVCVGAGRANEGLRASWLEQLKLVHDACGFQYLRFHGLFHDDMFVYRGAGGRPVYNWQYIDDLFDRMLAIDVRPFVELGFFPKDLAGGTRTQFWWKANVTPPADNAKWVALVSAFVEHCRARYGEAEVRRWYFEVWNEPDLAAFWDSTRSKYFELYRDTARAIKAIDGQLRVGGPSTSNFVADGRFDGETAQRSKIIALVKPEESEKHPWRPVWVAEFLDYCAREKLPVDFVSTHPYPTDWALDEDGRGRGLTRQVGATPRDLRLLRQMIDASPFPKAEIHLTEWSSTPSSRDFAHDSLPAATFVVKANVESAGLADSLSYWTFTDVFEEGGAGNTIFHGGFGLVNYQGIVKPTFHAYRMLHALGDETLATVPGAIVTRHKQDGRVTVLAYHYPPEMPLTVPGGSRAFAAATEKLGAPKPLTIELIGLKPGARMLIETLDQTHGNARAAWEAAGAPEPPTREQTAALRSAALATKRDFVQADASGRLALRRPIEPWSVVLVDEQ